MKDLFQYLALVVFFYSFAVLMERWFESDIKYYYCQNSDLGNANFVVRAFDLRAAEKQLEKFTEWSGVSNSSASVCVEVSKNN